MMRAGFLWVNNMPVIIDAELVLTQDRRLVVKDTRFGLCKSNYHNLPMINGVPSKVWTPV